ncbi:MAG: GAF domain-containing sensor histidine kinase [Chloroflexota bacterium]
MEIREPILNEMMTQPTMSAILQSIVAWAVELLQADEGTIFLWEQERQQLVQSTGYHYSEEYLDYGIVIKPGEGIAGRVIQSGQPMIIDDYLAWEGRLANANVPLSTYTTNLSVPMRWQQRPVGVLSIDADYRRRRFTEDDIRLSGIFANLAAVTIENARLYKSLQDRAAALEQTLKQEVAQQTAELAQRALQLETSALVSREITSILDLDKLLPRVVELIRNSFGYYSVMIFLVDRTTNRLVLRSASGDIGQRLQEQSFSLDLGPSGLNSEVAKTNASIVVNDISQEPRYLPIELLPDTRSELVIPLRLGDRVLGTLDVQSDQRNAFTAEDMLVIQSLGDQVAIAINNAHLYDRSRSLAIVEERNRLARELHDSVTQTIFSMTLASASARILLERDPSRVLARLDRLHDLAQGALKEIRSLIYQLRPVSVADAGFLPALAQHIDERQRRDGLQVTLHMVGKGELPPDWEAALFRIVQEALNNVVKHAQTNEATISLNLKGDIVSLRIEDRGLGFTADPVNQQLMGLGLTSMRERAELIGGTLALQSAPSEGTMIEVTIPKRESS